jgi:hypothetical protein
LGDCSSTLGSFKKITEIAQLGGFFPNGKSYVFALTNNGLAHILGAFFTNSSGRTASMQQIT